jgi:hypothetical protein
MDIAGTPQQALVYLNTHWGSRYSFAQPETRSGYWTATAKFSPHDCLQAASPTALLAIVRAHYQSHPTARRASDE